jgi:hypothetical protein
VCLEFTAHFHVDVLQEEQQILRFGRLRDVLLVVPEVQTLILELRMAVDVGNTPRVPPSEYCGWIPGLDCRRVLRVELIAKS